MQEAKHKSVAHLLTAIKVMAVNLESRDVRAQNFIVTLLMRHCQARAGMDKLEAFGGKPPDDPDKQLNKFREMATTLERFSLTDETFIVNVLQQAFKRRMAIDVGKLQGALAEMAPPKEAVN